jgi:CHASE2 domain-containing sensor protein
MPLVVALMAACLLWALVGWVSAAVFLLVLVVGAAWWTARALEARDVPRRRGE